MAETEEVQTTDLVFALAEDGRTLRVLVQPGAGHVMPPSEIHAAFLASEFASCHLFRDSIEKIRQIQRSSAEAQWLDAGERLDASFSIAVMPDHMAALLTITPAQGGDAVTLAKLQAALAKAGIVQGIKQNVLDDAVARQQAAALEVAAGKPAVDGQDGRFVSLLPEAPRRQPKVDKDGRVDHHELGTFFTVSPGSNLLRRIPATEGENGIDVYGKLVLAKPGVTPAFEGPMEGAAIVADDPHLLVATIYGQPVIHPAGASVDPTLTVGRVDLSTGNIDFQGTVHIKGDVISGMKIVATGDIEVSGTVEAAHLEAGGNVIVRNGIIGRKIAGNDAQESESVQAWIKCGANCQAKFVEHGRLEAGGDIVIDEQLMHCHTRAAGAVIIGPQHARHGSLIGGETYAGRFVSVHVLGSPANIKTQVATAYDEAMHARYAEVNKQLTERLAESNKVAQLVEHLRHHPSAMQPDLMTKAAKTLAMMQQSIVEIREEHLKLSEKIAQERAATVEVKRACYGGAHVLVAGIAVAVHEDRGPGSFSIRSDILTYE